MEKTPMGSRRHVTILGNVNAGKSTLFNAILGQHGSIVSNHRGTTTDPVVKAMELVPFGPIVLIDTGGLDDRSPVGAKRIERTKRIVDRTDLVLYAADVTSFDDEEYKAIASELREMSIPHILVFTKCDMVSEEKKRLLKEEHERAVFTSEKDLESIELLKKRIGRELRKLGTDEETLVGDILPVDSTVIMVVSIDAGAPKGRLILPQVQFIRDCLDHGIKCLVTKEEQLEEALSELKAVDLVVTDSQNFKTVERTVPRDIPLTSFSMLLARQKGDMDIFMEGVEKVEELTDDAKILIAEACTHNTSHEDIGRVKIPTLLKKHTGKDLQFDFYGGHDFPENLHEYELVVHCGGCMINKRAIETRLLRCQAEGVSVTNYGVLLAYLNGILPRCSETFYG